MSRPIGTARSVRLSPDEWAFVETFARRAGITRAGDEVDWSGAVRRIVQQYRDVTLHVAGLETQTIHKPEEGQP